MALSEYAKQLGAFLILVVVQSAAILLFKLCQDKNGKYTFNPASSVALTELCKLALAASLHYSDVFASKRYAVHAHVPPQAHFPHCARRAQPR